MSYFSTLVRTLSPAPTRPQSRRATPIPAVQTLEGRRLLSAVAIANAAVNEGGKLLYAVTLSAPSNKPVTVHYALAGGSAVVNRDFLPLKPGKLTFAPGQTAKNIVVKTKPNHLFSPNKNVKIRLTAPSAGNKIQGSGLGKGLIYNTDAQPVITILNATTTEGNAGNKILTFTLKMTRAAAEKPLKVNYTTVNSSATATGKNADFVATKGTLTFTALKKPQTIKVLVRGDKTKEANEAFLLKLKGSGFTVRNPLVPGADFAVGIIKNDDGGSVSANTTVIATPAAPSLTPGSGADVTLALNHISADPVTVHYYTSDGTAAAGTDYAPADASLTFNPGETSKTLTLSTLANSPGGTFNLNLASASAATIATPLATLTIQPSLSVADVVVVETNAGTTSALATVSLSASSTQAITVNYSTLSGTATAGSDFTPTAGTLTFNPGQTAKTISIPIVGDTIVESDETFTLSLATPVNALLAKPFGTVTITNDDTGSPANPVDNTGLTFDNTTGHGFTITQLVTDFHYGIPSTRTAPLDNLQLEFVLLPAGGNINTAPAYKTVPLGTINPGQTLTGDIDLSGSPTIPLGSGGRYATRLVSNGVVFAVFQSIAF